MAEKPLVIRETMISVAINTSFSVLFFLLFFGLSRPVSLAALAPDFFPQTFVIALMSTLVPPLMLRKRFNGEARSIARRSLLLAMAAAVIAGGSAYALFTLNSEQMMAPGWALAFKAVYGGILASLMTPIGLLWLIRARGVA